MAAPTTLTRTIVAALFLVTTGCQTTIPAPDSRRAHHEQKVEYALGSLREREAQSPDNLQATTRKFDQLIAGKPDSARNTTRRILELD